jgi:osmotically inducible protein OsmC
VLPASAKGGEEGGQPGPAAKGLDATQFQEFAEGAKKGCVVSRALAGVPTMTVKATLR